LGEPLYAQYCKRRMRGWSDPPQDVKKHSIYISPCTLYGTLRMGLSLLKHHFIIHTNTHNIIKPNIKTLLQDVVSSSVAPTVAPVISILYSSNSTRS
jgi:hypothetical protein